MKRWDVAKLHSKGTDERRMETTRERFLKSIGEKLMKEWDKATRVEGKWDILKSALSETAEEVLGHEHKKQPDWIRESEVDLKPLVAERNRLYALWLATGSERDRKRHAAARRVVRQAVRAAKDAWLQHKAAEAERERHG